jgi:hypothetical protein
MYKDVILLKDMNSKKEKVYHVIDIELKQNINPEILNNYITYP